MKTLLAQLISGQPLSADQAAQAFEKIMTGQASEAQTAAVLSLIQSRGPTAGELIGAAKVMRAKVERVEVPRGLTAIDTCGTGGDHAETFNISTAAAIVAAGAGRPRGVVVAKHGNRAVTSRSGSSQVLETLGVKLAVNGPTLTKCLDEAGICFCFAPSHHPAMKHAAKVRKELGFRTIFNLLGPLTNPAGARRQVIGVYAVHLTELIAQVLLQLGAEHAMVVHGVQSAGASGRAISAAGGALDELTTSGSSRISEVVGGQVNTYEVDPTTLGMALGHPASIWADGPESSAKIIRAVLDGAPGPARDVVCLNAAAALVVAGLADELTDGLQLAGAAIDSGAAAGALKKLSQISSADES